MTRSGVGFRIHQTLRQASMTGVSPALAFGITRSHGQSVEWYAGRNLPKPQALVCGPDTIFDLASLTKPLTTSLWFLRLISSGAVKLATPIGELVDVEDARLQRCPIWRLLNHSSGLPAHRRYYEGLGRSTLESHDFESARRRIMSMIRRTELEASPGEHETYSDLGFLLLEQCLEKIGRPLRQEWKNMPFHGDGSALHFRSSGQAGDQNYAATEDCPWRGHVLVGEVHDDNCWTMGGIGGHAGLFGGLRSVLAMGQHWLKALRGADNNLGVPHELVEEAVSHRWVHGNGTRVLGWDTPTPGASSSGRFLSRRAIGHLGFTGTSIWIDPEHDLCIVLLTNRVCPSRNDIRIRQLRPALHDLAFLYAQECFT